jgi:hypothetical protein
MIKTVTITNPSASTLTLDLPTSLDDEGILIFNMSGLGPPKATVNGVGGPSFEGFKVGSVRTDARHLMLTLAIPLTGTPEETAKQKIYTYFPIKKEVTFGIETDAKDVDITAIVESIEFNQFAKVENAVISLYCPYPYFLSTTLDNPTIASGGTLVTYDGEVETGVLIDLDFTGTVGDITITNSAGTQSMTLDWTAAYNAYDALGYTGYGAIPDNGDWCRIDTRHGQKSALYKMSGYPQINFMNGVGIDDDWIKLFLGANTLGFTPGTNTTMNILYNDIIEGV